MDQVYRDTTTQMEQKGVDTEYVIGWQGGYLGHPKREEQRVSDAYEAGFNDGTERKTDGFGAWVKQ